MYSALFGSSLLTQVLSNKAKIILNVPFRPCATEKKSIEVINLKCTFSISLSFSIDACSDRSDTNNCLYHLIVIRICSKVKPLASLYDLLVNLIYDIPSLRNIFRLHSRPTKMKKKSTHP